MTPQEKLVYECLSESGGMTIDNICAATGLKRSYVAMLLGFLEGRQKVRREEWADTNNKGKLACVYHAI
jgi:DNA-binding MarR family transcriptional regulator